MTARRLVLRREVLTELANDDLARVGGAALPTTPVGYCLDELLSAKLHCDSVFRPCISHTCTY